MNELHALILGIVEGITEFLPVSSTAHLILTADLLGLPHTGFLKSFEIIIQLGAILSVVVLYFKSLLRFPVLIKLAVAFIPTGVIGLLLYPLIKTYLLGNLTVVLAALFLGGIFILAFEHLYPQKGRMGEKQLEEISYRQCLVIGLFQAVAIVPGVSRSASTIIGGLLLGLPRKTIVEFSFLLAVPTMFAASAFDIYKNASAFSGDQFWTLAIGFITSFIMATLSIKWLLAFVKTKTFAPFGYYRIIIAAVFLAYIVVRGA